MSEQNPRPVVRVIQNVQVLRGLAALLVVFVHLDEILPWMGPSFGRAGVDLFFVISGFIMVYTTAPRETTPWSFIADRLARIVPIYWVITLAVFVIALAEPTLLQATRADWGELFQSLLFIPFMKSNGLIEPMLFVGWTLNYEMFFYILFAISLALPNRQLGAVSAIVCLACIVGVGLLVQPETVFGKFYTDTIVLEFALGVMIGLTHEKIPASAILSCKAAITVLVVAAIAAALLLPLLYPNASTFIVRGLPACLIVAGALALERWGWVVKSSWCLILGNASYSIYLTHPFVTQVTQKLAAKLQLGALTPLLVLTNLIGVCVLGIVVHRIFERPLSGMLRQLLRAQRLNPAICGAVRVKQA